MSDTAFSDWPEKVTPEERTERTARGSARVREVLLKAGVEFPMDEEHRNDFDPPLSIAEARHRVHERFEQTVNGCRFCAAEV